MPGYLNQSSVMLATERERERCDAQPGFGENLLAVTRPSTEQRVDIHIPSVGGVCL